MFILMARYTVGGINIKYLRQSSEKGGNMDGEGEMKKDFGDFLLCSVKYNLNSTFWLSDKKLK